MSTPVDDQALREIADKFISLANEQTETTTPDMIGLGFMFGASRYAAFVVASQCEDLDVYNLNIDEALDFYTKQFRSMMSQNLDQYKSQFVEKPRYEHLVKDVTKKT
ncbi:MAG: Unknown protein [uncultured Thiotrichaceae bacterium]|uniref:DUF3144 domain-containing protein n=1 Tax=uncultured Thiotrichaceae bacterium TaxID=298394 RepID=A0A6S6U2W5_9GAMM|nr:MAG: Unknown protein [uncultured Thiotrichaceae bacterium]